MTPPDDKRRAPNLPAPGDARKSRDRRKSGRRAQDLAAQQRADDNERAGHDQLDPRRDPLAPDREEPDRTASSRTRRNRIARARAARSLRELGERELGGRDPLDPSFSTDESLSASAGGALAPDLDRAGDGDRDLDSAGFDRAGFDARRRRLRKQDGGFDSSGFDSASFGDRARFDDDENNNDIDAASAADLADVSDLPLTEPAALRDLREHPLARVARRLRTHAAFGLAPALAPALLFVPLGFLLGPPGLNFLPVVALDHLDPVISVGLAALGVFVGLALGRRPHWVTRLFVAASLEAIVTIVVVLGAILTLLNAWHFPASVPMAALALALGVSASASSAVSASGGLETTHGLASRIADLDDVVPIAIGALAIGFVVHDGVAHAIGQVILTALLGLVVGLLGWLLIERAQSVAERGVFVMGSLAFAGGASAYLSLSPLLAGLAAGMFWNWSPGRADVIVREDLRKFQHPLVVLMLLVAGARLELSLPALWLFAPFVVFRLAGKLAGGWLASRFTPGLAPGDLGAYLLAPGLLGIAFALNAQQHLPSPDGVALLTAVVIGTLASEGVALFMTPGEDLD